jgi:hypothetical protein
LAMQRGVLVEHRIPRLDVDCGSREISNRDPVRYGGC